ncbi:anthranilate synthase component I family protein [Sediminibacterium sp. C3]|uniref:anthranilate synthase component I family protein n=1 Tax=Sediminibacterium sp. C3 TaxID=1267211 RepID=UPI00040D563F|nr:anthranilate synthase component I family protein [Sediminibacterium sp. C3]
MKRNRKAFSINEMPNCKEQILQWIQPFGVCSFLDNHQYQLPHHSVDCLAAAGALEAINGNNTASAIDAFYKKEQDWLFGHFSYEYNTPENLRTQQRHPAGFSDAFFFRPDHILQLSNKELIIESYSKDPELIFCEISNIEIKEGKQHSIHCTPRTSREDYLQTIQDLLKHIQNGDCYEINFCQEFYAENIELDPAAVYRQLTRLSPNPFACYYKENNAHLLCASPERWLKKEGGQLWSQPIKGTLKRDLNNLDADKQLRDQLSNSLKDKSENVMVVDLVRNDLSQVCIAGSVKVSELFGIYSFPQVHQMISTITGELLPGKGMKEIIHSGFPMGSMTGAPKKRVMELIRQYEPIERGIFSGAVGYIKPNQDFDFNVVIRSILYNDANKYLSYLVGSGITIYSDPEQEYQECLLKAKAIEGVLGN